MTQPNPFSDAEKQLLFDSLGDQPVEDLVVDTIAAATTGFLALGAALLALPAGYLALIAIMADRSAGFPFVVPATTLAGLLIGTPVIATIGTYLLTGRNPAQGLARRSS
ncbi:MAG: hypothetical protein V3V01_04025 [Acidimicrobiales bacterium]